MISRHCIGPIVAKTQGELNSFFTGSAWSLADRYTIIAKIMTISMFYSLLNPISMFIAAFTFALVFFIDRYLLLRKLKPICMLSAEIAVRLRQQAILCVALHMIVSLRFIYSWPMDGVWYRDDDDSYMIVNKLPPLSLFIFTQQPWMSHGQQRILIPYKIATIIVIIITLFIWIFQPILLALYDLFYTEDHVVGDTQNIDFSTVHFIPVYCPTISFKNNTYMCSYLDNVRENHRASFIRPLPNDRDNIADYIAPECQKHVLSVVKYYRDENDDIFLDKAEQGLMKNVMGSSMHHIGPSMPILDAMMMNKIEPAPQFELIYIQNDSSSPEPLQVQSPQQSSQLQPTVHAIPLELTQKLNERTISNESRRNQQKTRRSDKKNRRIVRSREVEGYGYAPLPASTALSLPLRSILPPSSNKRDSSSSIHPMLVHSDYNDDDGRGGSESKEPQEVVTYLKPNRVLLKPLQLRGK